MSSFNPSFSKRVVEARNPAPGVFRWSGWLREAWRVLNAAPGISAALGLGYTALCWLAYAAATALPLFSATFFTLLLAASPFLAAAAYAAAMQIEKGEQPTFASCARSVAERAASLGVFATLSGLIMAAWIRLTGILFAVYYGALGPSRAEVARVWVSGDVPVDMLVFLGGATVVLAATLFTVAVIALPRIVERDWDVVQAIGAGMRVLRANPSTVAAWAVVLLVMIGIALASQLLLMPLVFPLLAYATWFGYADLVDDHAGP